MIPRPAILSPRLGSLLLVGAALALPTAHAKAAKRSAPAVSDFRKLSGAYPRECAAPVAASLAALGQPSLRRCGWSEHVEMLYWDAVQVPVATCLVPPALAWHQLASAMQGAAGPWINGSSGQVLLAAPANGAMRQAGAVWRNADGRYSAVLWRWQPSTRAATRNWQAGRWQGVVDAVRALDSGRQAPASPLLQAWLAASRGKPRALDGNTWRWQSEGACLSLQTEGVTQARLLLPHSRDDARQEQRSAMQVQLARRFPQAQWLQPFTLLEPAVQGAHTGAKFLAVWKEGTLLQGRLWIPLPQDGGIVRAHLTTPAPAGAAAPAQELTKQRAGLIERELGALAHAWEAIHE